MPDVQPCHRQTAITKTHQHRSRPAVRLPPLANLRILEIEKIKAVLGKFKMKKIGEDDGDGDRKKSAADRLIELGEEIVTQVFVDEHGTPMVAVSDGEGGFQRYLDRKLEEFRDYNNAARVHRGLAGVAPAKRAGAPCPAPAALAQCGWQQHCRCLFQNPIALDYDFATDTPPGITFGVIHPFGMWHENTISHSPREVEAR